MSETNHDAPSSEARMIDRLMKAILRCKPFAMSIFLTYVLSSSLGIFMAHAGNGFALAQRDKTVHKALTSDKSSIAYQSGNRATALVVDFAGNVFLVMLLQFIPFSLCIGAGVRCGVELYRRNADTSWRFWRYRLPREAFVDLGLVFAVAVPLFFVASAFEFLSAWNV